MPDANGFIQPHCVEAVWLPHMILRNIFAIFRNCFYVFQLVHICADDHTQTSTGLCGTFLTVSSSWEEFSEPRPFHIRCLTLGLIIIGGFHFF